MLTWINYAIGFGIVLGAYLLSFVASFLLKGITKLTKKSKTNLDDEILKHLSKPVKVIFIFVGLYFVVRYLNPGLTIFKIHFSQYFIIVGIFIAAYLVSNIIASFFRWYAREIAVKNKKKVDNTLLRFLRRFVVIIVYVVALIIVLDRLKIEIAPLIAGSGIAGLAVALALQDTLSNLFSAVYITADKPIKVGDFIELDADLKGYVEDVGWRSTRIRTLGNNKIIIPNSKLAQSVITNYDESAREMSVLVNLGVAYDSDFEKVEKVTIDVAKQIQKTVEGAKKDHEPFIRYNNFGNSSIDFTVILRANEYVGQYLIKHEFVKALMSRYKKEGIEIPFPQRDVWFKNQK